MEDRTPFITTGIPWVGITGERLEQIVFWLLDALGAQDLAWRAGGEDSRATDGGRDLEATFYAATPDGDLQPERWWVEVKGRNRTVEPSAVKDAVLNAMGHAEVDVLVICSNSRFSNPTRDWLTEFARTNKRPRVRLWDRDLLERMLLKHPHVLARVVPHVLSEDGRVQWLIDRFIHQSYLPSTYESEFFWDHPDLVIDEPMAILALVCAEASDERPLKRPWGTLLNEEQAISLLVVTLANYIALAERESAAGFSQDTLMPAASFALATALVISDTETVLPVCCNPWRFVGDVLEPPDGLADALMLPIVATLQGRMFDACVQDCHRVSVSKHGHDPAALPTFWHQWIEEEPPSEQAGMLIMEQADRKCTLDLASCPLYRDVEDWRAELPSLREVLLRRRVLPEGGATWPP